MAELKAFVLCPPTPASPTWKLKLLPLNVVREKDIFFISWFFKPVQTFAQAQAWAPFFAMAKVHGTDDEYKMCMVVGSTDDGRQRIPAAVGASAVRHIRRSRTQCVVIADAGNKCVSMLDDLADPCLFAFKYPTASILAIPRAPAAAAAAVAAVLNYPWPQHMQGILNMGPGTVGVEHVRHFKIKGVRRWHMDDFPGHQERLVFYINNVAVELSISREHSKCAGVPHDVLRQVDGQLPDNFDSPALAQVLQELHMSLPQAVVFMSGTVHSDSQRKLLMGTVHGAAACGMIPAR